VPVELALLRAEVLADPLNIELRRQYLEVRTPALEKRDRYRARAGAAVRGIRWGVLALGVCTIPGALINLGIAFFGIGSRYPDAFWAHFMLGLLIIPGGILEGCLFGWGIGWLSSGDIARRFAVLGPLPAGAYRRPVEEAEAKYLGKTHP
jgi:hypothetical protein